MTMNYCGRCGSANGATARFCRQCGADLSSQAAASSSSTPFNVEFSTKPAKKNPEKESRPALSKIEPASGAGPAPEAGEQDPRKISASLRRIRASGPLILAAIKQNDPESMERINEIIEQSIQGRSEDTATVDSSISASAKSSVDSGTAAEPPAPAPTQRLKARETNKSMSLRAMEAPAPQAAHSTSAGQSVIKQNSQALIRAAAQKSARANPKTPAHTDGQTMKQKAAIAKAQLIARKVTNWLSVSNGNRQISQAPQGGAHSGPSTVLMQASGFKPMSSIGPKVILVIIALAVLLAFPIYFIFRDRLLTQAQPADVGLNLISPADQSAQLVKAGLSERAQSRYKAAIENFQRALELTPNNLDIKFRLAQTYVMARQIDEAARTCREIIRINPDYLDARLQLAEIYNAKGNWNAAYREYQYIIETAQNSPHAADALAAIERQQAVAQMEERAAENARRGRRSRSTIPSLPVAAIRDPVPLLTPELSEARRVIPRAALSDMDFEEKPDPRGLAEAHKRLGVRYLNIREFRAAINEFLQALNLTPDDKDLYYFIGSSLHGSGRQAEAYDYYRRVDSGPYVGPAESGAKQTRKAFQEANKRRNERQSPPIKNEIEEINQNKPTKHKSVMNRILDTLR